MIYTIDIWKVNHFMSGQLGVYMFKHMGIIALVAYGIGR